MRILLFEIPYTPRNLNRITSNSRGYFEAVCLTKYHLYGKVQKYPDGTSSMPTSEVQMAKNIFRITPRASTAMRAIEDAVQALARAENPQGVVGARAVFHFGDFRFEEEAGFTWARFDRVQIMWTLSDDRESFLTEDEYMGYVKIKPWRAKCGTLCYHVLETKVFRIPTSAHQPA